MRIDHRGRSRLALVLFTVLGLLLVACGGGDSDSGSEAGPETEPEESEAVELRQGGSITYARQTEPRNFDPARMQVGPIAGIAAQAVYDQLFYQGQDGEPEPGLATSLEVDDGNRVYTITLREGVTFSDGTPFDADAVIAHWTRIKDPATASPGILDAMEIESMEAVDPLTLRVTLSAPDATFKEPLMTGNLTYIPSPTAVESAGENYGTSPDTTVGAGPFLLEELVFSDHQTYVRNPDYWDAPKPYLDEMTFKTFLDGQARFNTFVSGGADLIENLTAGESNIELDRDYTNVSPLPTGGGYGFAFRTDSGPTADPRVRKAMAYAVDIDAVLERANPGSTPAHTLFDEDAPWYTDLALPYNDPERAQELLDEYLEETGQSEVTVDIIHAETSAPLMEALQQEWEKLDGLNVNVTIETNVQTASRIASRDYPGGLVSAVGGSPRVLRTQLSSGAPTNVSFLSDPEIDEALQTATESDDPDEVREAMRVVAERFNETLPFFIFNRLNSATWHTDELGGIQGMVNAPVVWRTQDLGFVE